MEPLTMILVSLLCALLVPIAIFITRKTKFEWEKDYYMDYSRIFLMLVLMSTMLCVSVYSSLHLWYGFFVGVMLGYSWKNRKSPFLGAALGTIFFFNNLLYFSLAILIIIIITYGPKLKHVDFLLFLSMAVLFSYINQFSADLSIFMLSAAGGGIGGLMTNEVGELWKSMKKKRKQ